MQYCSHLLAGTSKSQFDPFDSIERRAIRIVEYPKLTDGSDPLVSGEIRWLSVCVVPSIKQDVL